MFQCNKHVEIKKFLCSLMCTLMAIIDSQFYIIDSLSELFHLNEMLNWWLPGCNSPGGGMGLILLTPFKHRTIFHGYQIVLKINLFVLSENAWFPWHPITNSRIGVYLQNYISDAA